MNISIYKKLDPWMIKPFQFLFHAETHYRNSSDYSKRMAFISFDNSIEVSIFTFMHNNTKPKGAKIYEKKTLDNVKNSFFDKLDIFEKHIQHKGLPITWDKDNINYYHEQRNKLYHDVALTSPDTNELYNIRQISLWVFSNLFNILDVELLLSELLSESELEFPKIPSELVKPKIEGVKESHESSLFFVSILGAWNEKSQGDIEIINELVSDSNKLISDIQEINIYNNEIFSLKNGYWKVQDKVALLIKYAVFFYDHHLETIKNIATQVLSEINPMFDFKREERYTASIYGKIPMYSSELRKGICETLVFLAIHGNKLTNCTQHKPEDTAILTIRELLENASWKTWASMNDLLPVIAEISPNGFLSSVEYSLEQDPSPFDELFNQESTDLISGANYMTGLYWALETLAWSEEYLSRALLALAELASHDPGGRWGNRPGNSIVTILLPWMPQTTATVAKRISSLKGIQRNFPNIAWNTLMKLLPNQSQASSGSHKPSFRDFIPDNFNEKVTEGEYWDQVAQYATLAVEMAKGNISYVSELVENLENIPESSLKSFIEHISSEEITNLPDEQKQPIWESLFKSIKKHRRYSDADWVLSKDVVNLIEQAADKLLPSNPEYSCRYLFSENVYHFLDKNVDWNTEQEMLFTQRKKALNEIYGIKKTVSIINFAENVDQPIKVGNVFAYIANEENDQEFLPQLLDSQEEFKKQFISGYIWFRYELLGITWISTFNTETWTKEQKCHLLTNLPFENEIWEKADELLQENVDLYWKEVRPNPYATKSNLLSAVTNLLRYGRPFISLDCINAQYYSKKEFYRNEATQALIDGISSNEVSMAMSTFHITEIIKILQDDPQVSEADLFRIEWGYLPLLVSYNDAKPKVLEKQLSQDPNLFIDLIKLIYRSKNDIDEKDLEQVRKDNASNAWKLLNKWRRPPGKLDDGTFSEDELYRWVNEVKTKTIESGHYAVAMIHLGHILFYSGSDPDGLWINKSVAELLDEKENDDIRRGFSTEVYNSRGVHHVDPSGKPEMELAEMWRKNADEVENLGLINFASLLKEIANSYNREAERVNNRLSEQ